MKLVCSQTEFNSALQLVTRAVASRPTHPVLANVLLTADEGTSRLSLTGFDLNLGIQTSFSASVESSGAITLPARLLGEIVSRLSNDVPISLSTDESGEQVELISDDGSYSVRGMPSEDYPDLPLVENGTSLKVKVGSLLLALKRTIFSSSSDEAKQLLTGVHLTFRQLSMEAAATDGHRLAVLNISNALDVENKSDASEDDVFSITLPSRSLREVEKLMGYWDSESFVNLFFDRGQVVVMASDQIITSRILEGDYPNYKQLIPDDFINSIKLNKRNFISSLERVAVLADQHNNVVKLYVDPSSQKIEIIADVQDVGSGSESVAVEFKGTEMHIAFNVRYMLDGLKAIESEYVLLQCNAPTTPAIISPVDEKNNFTYLIMPVQIRS